VVSGDDARGWNGARGFVHEHLAQKLGTIDSIANYYVAGPPAMVEAVLMTLNADVGIPLERIFYDRFFY
jgi:toluene monooxygenase electron transfer component